jgi:hypothetical protein
LFNTNRTKQEEKNRTIIVWLTNFVSLFLVFLKDVITMLNIHNCRSQQVVKSMLSLLAIFTVVLMSGFVSAEDVIIGERPVLENSLDQVDIESGELKLSDLIKHGRFLFKARFNTLDGQGRPASTGTGAPRIPDQPAFIRTSSPEANSCFGCHNQPSVGGAGDFVANVFVLAQALDPVTFSVSPEFSNERNTVGMYGAGPIEILAREMTADLIAIREEATDAAATSGQNERRELLTKGVSFGFITVLPDGMIDPSEIEGVDWDLIIKPFHQKGAVVSIREFTNNAMNHHHGMQSTERFGENTDPDQDGIMNELTTGDITALTIFQAALGTPGEKRSKYKIIRDAATLGQMKFSEIGCNNCHIPKLVLNDRNFTEPNPYNPDGNLQLNGEPVFSFDMTIKGAKPRLEKSKGKTGAIVRAFTDLKRWNLNDEELDHFANEQLSQGMINGQSDPSDFTIAPFPRPTEEFLTSKLWDAGNSDPYGHRGDLTLLTDAIHYHGGDARSSRDAFFALPDSEQAVIIEFLKTLQVLTKSSNHDDDSSWGKKK